MLLIRKISVSFFSLVFAFSILFGNSAIGTASAKSEENEILHIYYSKGVPFNLVEELIIQDSALPYEFTATIEVGKDIITFGLTNIDKLKGEDFVKLILPELKLLLESMSYVYEDAKEESLKVTILSFKDSKENISKKNIELNNSLTKELSIYSDSIVVGKINEMELNQFLKELQDDNIKKQDYSLESVKEIVTVDLTEDELLDSLNIKMDKEREKQRIIPTTDDGANILETRGGPSYNWGMCDTSAKNPRCGDGQDRLRMHDDGGFNSSTNRGAYNWLPRDVYGEAKTINTTTRQVSVLFSWTNDRLNNLRIDNNEALEVEVLFYNYGQGVGIPQRGKAFMNQEPYSWSSNLPGAYKDTRFLDDPREPSYAVGTKYINDLDTRTYSFVMNARWYNTDNDDNGLWQINFSRGYYLVSTHPGLRAYQELYGTDEWFIFNEEYEIFAKVKQYHKYDSGYWAPGEYGHMIEPNQKHQWNYKHSFQDIYKGNTYDTGAIHTNNYKVYRINVDTPQTYTFETLPYGSTRYDTYLQLYDQRIIWKAWDNDGGSGLYSKISIYLDKGTYYLIVDEANFGSMRSYLRVQ